MRENREKENVVSFGWLDDPTSDDDVVVGAKIEAIPVK